MRYPKIKRVCRAEPLNKLAYVAFMLMTRVTEIYFIVEGANKSGTLEINRIPA